ncbi:hypothetical protein [Nguyenibacter vanlangensis]|uniref:Uncharacterized protein n=1 Tax=Nguyenibacter vanlangensis TaxID=1216886 RepID=A0A7Y7ITH0_9PROT|nr:hypothetical protein [Nguyenibacter vanlangensis]NVN09808.1 hypothetical protein [Nguyenibacter vanlangensis]
MQRLVIDSNMLQSEKLRRFLDASVANFAVLPDFAWFELYKQKSVEAIVAALSVIGDFPEQIIVLKSGSEIAQIDPRTSMMTTAMQRTDVARDIREMVAILNGPDRNKPEISAQLERLWSGAVNLLPGMLEGAQDIMTSLPEMAEQMFAPQQLRIIRMNTRYPEDMFSSIFGAADQIWETLSSVDSRHNWTSEFDEFKNHTYLYRYALAIVIYLLWWIKNGSQNQKRLDRVRNDLIDLSFAVYGTYFEGLMTADKNAEWMHQNLYLALDAIDNA